MKSGDAVFSESGDLGTVTQVLHSGRVMVEWTDGYDQDKHIPYDPSELTPVSEWNWTCPACGSEDLTWYSGEPGTHISLNGTNSGECNTCHTPFAMGAP